MQRTGARRFLWHRLMNCATEHQARVFATQRDNRQRRAPYEKLVVVIPAFNEEAQVAKTVRGVRGVLPEARIVVVNDGSVDRTASLARESGAVVISLPINLGYGSALRTGYMYAATYGADIVIQLDGDGQHAPESIPALLRAADDPEVQVIIGSRFLGKCGYPIPWIRRSGQLVFEWLVRWLTRERDTDPTSGFQLIKGEVLWFYTSEDFPSDYPDADVLLMLHRAGIRWVEVAAEFRPSPTGKSMHTGLKPFYYVFRMIFSLLLTLIRRRPSPIRSVKRTVRQPPAQASAEEVM